MLFEMNGYFDSAVHSNDGMRHIILYSSNSLAMKLTTAASAKCIPSLAKYPDITLSIYFSQLYHTRGWISCLAVEPPKLSGAWPVYRLVTPQANSGGMWYSLLSNFVSGVQGATVFPAHFNRRALADRHNAHEINAITGVKPYFTRCSPSKKRIQT